jgi:hypothetical protein
LSHGIASDDGFFQAEADDLHPCENFAFDPRPEGTAIGPSHGTVAKLHDADARREERILGVLFEMFNEARGWPTADDMTEDVGIEQVHRLSPASGAASSARASGVTLSDDVFHRRKEGVCVIEPAAHVGEALAVARCHRNQTRDGFAALGDDDGLAPVGHPTQELRQRPLGFGDAHGLPAHVSMIVMMTMRGNFESAVARS